MEKVLGFNQCDLNCDISSSRVGRCLATHANVSCTNARQLFVQLYWSHNLTAIVTRSFLANQRMILPFPDRPLHRHFKAALIHSIKVTSRWTPPLPMRLRTARVVAFDYTRLHHILRLPYGFAAPCKPKDPGEVRLFHDQVIHGLRPMLPLMGITSRDLAKAVPDVEERKKLLGLYRHSVGHGCVNNAVAQRQVRFALNRCVTFDA